MQTLETLRRRIDNVRDMQSVVTTMKTLAAVSIRQYEAAVEALAEYDRALQLAFQILMRDHSVPVPQAPSRRQRSGVIVFGSDQGMCGQFNEEIASFTASAIRRSGNADGRAVLAIGGRAHARLEDLGIPVDESYRIPVSVGDITRLVEELLPLVQRWRAELGVEALTVFYNRKTSAASYQPRRIQLLPIGQAQLQQWQQQPWESSSLPMFTMPRLDLFAAAVRQHLFIALFRASAESLASENASRIVSMQAAEKNIEETLAELQTQFNQQRQTSITEELLDVVTGFEALAKKKRR